MAEIKFTVVSVVGIALFTGAGFLSLRGDSPDEKNINTVKTYWDEVWNKGNLKGVEDFYHPNAIHGEDFSIPAFQKNVESFRQVIPDLKIEIDEVFAKDDKVICRVRYTGTHTGRKIFGQEPLGKRIDVPGMDIFIMKEGKCVEHQHVADHLDLVFQIGMKLAPVPATGEDQTKDK